MFVEIGTSSVKLQSSKENQQLFVMADDRTKKTNEVLKMKTFKKKRMTFHRGGNLKSIMNYIISETLETGINIFLIFNFLLFLIFLIFFNIFIIFVKYFFNIFLIRY